MYSSILKLALAFLCTFANLVSGITPIYSPLRAPALPLAVRSPYTNAWASSSNDPPTAVFWQGSGLGWEGILTVDDIAYEYLGNGLELLPPLQNIESAQQTNITYDSQWSNFTFKAGPIMLTAAFFSPVVPQDLCRTSIPLSYLQTSFQSLDGAEHDVKLYSDVNGKWVDASGDNTIRWSLETICVNCTNDPSKINPPSRNLSSWIVELETETIFGERSDSAQWSTLAYTSAPGDASNFSWESGYSINIRYKHLNGPTLSGNSDSSYRSTSDREPVFAFSHHFPSARQGNVLYTIGNIQQPAVQYLSSSGLARLEPWWTTCHDDFQQMIDWHYADFATAAVKGAAFEAQLRSDVSRYYQNNTAFKPALSTRHAPEGSFDGIDQFGQPYNFDADDGSGFLDPATYSGISTPDTSEVESYYAIVALSTRQIMGAFVLTVPPPPSANASTTANQSEPLMFQKEISSNGNVNTVDVLYPALPFFLYANPQLLKYALNPLYLYQDSGFYPNAWSIHDIGSMFPNATGHLPGDDEAMPVEECGDMLIMSYAYYKFSGDRSFLEAHYARLVRWGEFLDDYSLIPETQLSTDDFSGTLANQTNLAIKGIIGLQVLSLICDLVGEKGSAHYYTDRASEYLTQWTDLAIDPSGRHTMLAYQFRSSWGLLYNLFPDKLLGLGFIPAEIYEMQSAFYPTVSQVFGVPLDSRHSYTKSDWEMWTAATCSPATRRLLVTSLAYWLNNTSTSLAFTDLFETVSTGEWPDVAKFIARPVVGGHFSLLALLKAGQDSGSALNYDSSSSDNVFTDTNAAYLTVTASDDSAIIAAISTLTADTASFGGTVSSVSEPPTVTWTGIRLTTMILAD